MINIVLIVILLFLFIVLGIKNNKPCGRESFIFKETASDRPTPKKPTPKKPTPKVVVPAAPKIVKIDNIDIPENCLLSINAVKKIYNDQLTSLRETSQLVDVELNKHIEGETMCRSEINKRIKEETTCRSELNKYKQRLNDIPLSYNANGLPDKAIIKMYRMFCDKFGKEGGIQLTDMHRNQTMDDILMKGLSYASDPALKSTCYINPPPLANQVTGDFVIKNIYEFFCNNLDDKNLVWARDKTALQIWNDAKLWATLPDDSHRKACYKDPFVANQKLGGNLVKNMYNFACEEYPITEWGKMAEYDDLWKDAKLLSTLPGDSYRKACYKFNN